MSQSSSVKFETSIRWLPARAGDESRGCVYRRSFVYNISSSRAVAAKAVYSTSRDLAPDLRADAQDVVPELRMALDYGSTSARLGPP